MSVVLDWTWPDHRWLHSCWSQYRRIIRLLLWWWIIEYWRNRYHWRRLGELCGWWILVIVMVMMMQMICYGTDSSAGKTSCNHRSVIMLMVLSLRCGRGCLREQYRSNWNSANWRTVCKELSELRTRGRWIGI